MKTFSEKRCRSAHVVRRRSLQSILRSAGAQARLTIGQPNDKYEQEADSVADRVMSMPDSQLRRQLDHREEEENLQAKPLADQVTPLVQRQEDAQEDTQEEEEPVQAQLGGGEIAQRQPAGNEEEEELVQAKEQPGQMPQVTPNIESRINRLKGGGQPLDRVTRAFFEPRFGRDFSQVQLHTDSAAADTAKSINARAFTVGNHVVMGSGEYQPNSQSGQRLLGHELTHVVQQKGGAALISTCKSFDDTIRMSPLSDELSELWRTQGKGVFYDRLRQVAPLNDADFIPFVFTLHGDDLWLTQRIINYGRESNWPIHLRVEREMKKKWTDTRGKGAVFNILRRANGAEAANAQLTASIKKVFAQGTQDRWLAQVLQALGPERDWPQYLTVLWADIQAGAMSVPTMEVSGAELQFEEVSIPNQTAYNCYEYAMGETTDFRQPGGGVSAANQTVSGVLTLLTSDMGSGPSNCDTPCASGRRKIMAVVTDDATSPNFVRMDNQPTRIVYWLWDFHFYRQDIGGIWSHKPGSTRHRLTDNGGARITDPRTANRVTLENTGLRQFGKPAYRGIDYRNIVGCWCVLPGTR